MTIATARNDRFRAIRAVSPGVSRPLPAGASNPYGIAFDGTNIWTANYTTGTVTRLVP